MTTNKFFGVVILIVGILLAFTFTACKDDADDNVWWKWVAPASTVTVDYSVEADGVCIITVGGTAEAEFQRHMAHVGRSIPAQAVNTRYIYKIEAWTDAGERTLTVQYYENNNTSTYLGEAITINSKKKTYDIFGHKIPGNEETPGLRFQCADQLGTFYVRIVSIQVNESCELTITNFTGNSDVAVIWVSNDNNHLVAMAEKSISGNSVTFYLFAAATKKDADGLDTYWSNRDENGNVVSYGYMSETPWTGSGAYYLNLYLVEWDGPDLEIDSLVYTNGQPTRQKYTFSENTATIAFDKFGYESGGGDFGWTDPDGGGNSQP